MVVLSAAVVTTGKTLVARQFVEMTRLRVEGLIGAFQKLVDVGRDHTFIETETVRYVYQPIERLHLLLVTDKSSNILEDLETLRLLAKVVKDCCRLQVNEEEVLRHGFDLVFAFGEVISFGHRESVTLSQVKSYTEMDSYEEKLHQRIEQSKISEAREMAKKRQLELKRQRQDGTTGGGLQMEGFGSSGTGGGGGDDAGGGDAGGGTSGERTLRSSQESMPTTPGGGSGSMAESAVAWNPAMCADAQATVTVRAMPKKGMALGKRRLGDIILAGMGEAAAAQAEEVAEEAQAPTAPAFSPLADPVKVEIKEKVTADLEVEGGLRGEATCSGSFEVTILDPAKAAQICFKLAQLRPEFKYSFHPSLNKASCAQNVLEARQGVTTFPAGGCLRWQTKTSKDDFLPVAMSCWPTPNADGTEMVLELELTDDEAALENVTICFPCPNSARPQIASASLGEAAHRDGQVIWHIPVLDNREGSGTLQFTASADTASLLPASFEATQSTTRCPVEILECYHRERKDTINYACERRVTYELKIGA